MTNIGLLKPRLGAMLLYLRKHCKPGKQAWQLVSIDELHKPIAYLLSQSAMMSIADLSLVPKTAPKLTSIKDIEVISMIESCIVVLEQTQNMKIEQLADLAYIPNATFKRLLQIGAIGFANYLSQPVCESPGLSLPTA